MMKHRISFLLAVILATVLCLSGYDPSPYSVTTANDYVYYDYRLT